MTINLEHATSLSNVLKKHRLKKSYSSLNRFCDSEEIQTHMTTLY